MSTNRFMRRHRAGISLALAMIFLGSESVPSHAEAYASAKVDDRGQLRIVTQSGRTIVPKKLADQVGFDAAQVSPDGRAVGWLAQFPNCCTSYPIPLKLVIRSNGRDRTFTGDDDLPVWRWRFTAGGKQVAFEQETVHGGMGIHYELRDVATGKLIAAFDPAPGYERNSGAEADSVAVPEWVAGLDAQQ
jgi:hypothetical protein